MMTKTERASVHGVEDAVGRTPVEAFGPPAEVVSRPKEGFATDVAVEAVASPNTIYEAASPVMMYPAPADQ